MTSPPPQLGDLEAHVWITTAASVASVRDGRPLLDEAERERASNISSPGAALLFERGRAWTRSVVAGYLDMHPGDLIVRVGPQGKPHLGGRQEGVLDFNASHAGDLVAVAVSRSPVGIDIEFVRELNNFVGMADRVLAAPERTALDLRPASERLAAFFEFWTRKEAFLKGVGTGIRSRLARVVTQPDAGGAEEVVDWEEDPDVAQQWRLQRLSTPSGYVGAIAVQPSTTIRLLP